MTKEYFRVLRHTNKTGSADVSVPPVSSSASAGTASAGATRNAKLQPFASDSPWNMPLGANAVYRTSGLNGQPGGGNVNAFVPGGDSEIIVQTPTAARMAILSCNVAWTGGNRCVGTDVTRTAVPVRSDFIVANSNSNNCAVFLLSDSRTYTSNQPFTHCTAGVAVATSFAFSFANQDAFGAGLYGSHGGSGLSAIGGSLRLGELRPGDSTGPQHAIKVNVFAPEFLFRNTTRALLYRWPADRADSIATAAPPNGYGTYNNGSVSNTDMKMGCLLALHPTFDITYPNLSSTPGRLIAWTFQNYGAYVVDNVGVAGFAFGVESGEAGSFPTQFQTDWGTPFSQHANSATAWRRDISKICDNLYVVTNNGPVGTPMWAGGPSGNGIGGGGTPRRPLAATIGPT